MDTVFYYHPIFLEHDTGWHPESPGRLAAILRHLGERYGEGLVLKTPRRAAIEDAARIHDPAYLRRVEAICREGGGSLDPDTPVSARSFEAALHAAGALLDGSDALAAGAASAFGLVRPPGHHARRAAGMGFCIVNNVAVAAAYLKERHGLSRLLIADFDAHHGNGTQEAFYRDGSVFYLSMHLHPFYPGSGRSDETGEGPGTGTTLNIPIPAGRPAAGTIASFREGLLGSARRHRPEMILVSAGFDGYQEDPLAGMGLLPEHFEQIGRTIREAAAEHCGGKVLTALEGGYSLAGLPLCVAAYVDGLEARGPRG